MISSNNIEVWFSYRIVIFVSFVNRRQNQALTTTSSNNAMLVLTLTKSVRIQLPIDLQLSAQYAGGAEDHICHPIAKSVPHRRIDAGGERYQRATARCHGFPLRTTPVPVEQRHRAHRRGQLPRPGQPPRRTAHQRTAFGSTSFRRSGKAEIPHWSGDRIHAAEWTAQFEALPRSFLAAYRRKLGEIA